MPQSRKRVNTNPRTDAGAQARKRLKQIDPRAPWKRSWWVLWGFITVVGELMLIAVLRGGAQLSVTQQVVIFIAIPILVHMLISGVRSLLFVISK